MNIRPASHSDAPSIAEFVQECILNIDRDYSPKQLQAWSASNDTTTWEKHIQEKKVLVAEDDTLQGVGSIHKNEITALFVREKGSGLGTQLFEELVQHASGQLETYASLNAVEFYEKKGFQPVKECKVSMNGTEIPCLLMQTT